MGRDGGGEPGVLGAEPGLLWELRGRCEQWGPESGGFGQDDGSCLSSWFLH